MLSAPGFRAYASSPSSRADAYRNAENGKTAQIQAIRTEIGWSYLTKICAINSRSITVGSSMPGRVSIRFTPNPANLKKSYQTALRLGASTPLGCVVRWG